MGEQKFTLKELRAKKDWTQRETADKLGISAQTYNSWEKDISGVAVRKVKAVADLFDVRLGQIFFTRQHENNSCEAGGKEREAAAAGDCPEEGGNGNGRP